MSSNIFTTDIDSAQAKKWAEAIDDAIFKAMTGGKSPVFPVDPRYNPTIHKPLDAIDMTDRPATQPKTERMRDWKQK